MALIKTYKSTPTAYTHASRDFQTIGHVYEALFNAVKLPTDMVDKMVPNSDFDRRMLNASATTVGFIRKHEYNAKDLTMILSSFAFLLRKKGTKIAIENAINILLRSQGVYDSYTLEIDSENKLVTLKISKRLEDLVLLTDLFDYLLPFGFHYIIYLYTVGSLENNLTTAEVSDTAELETDVKNKAIVNETFKTTISGKTELNKQSDEPRVIHNGVITNTIKVEEE